MKTRSIIITAAGAGKRMGAAQPKQFLPLLGKPVLMHTVERIHAFSPESQLVLTLPENYLDTWKQLCEDHAFALEIVIVIGGKERYHSIQHALKVCTGALIAVHDGVRPLVVKETLERLFNAAETHTAVIPVVDVKDSLRTIENTGSHAADRTHFKIVQTPQVFHTDVLKKAYTLPFTENITDDASLVEQSGEPIFLVEGNDENIKITTPTDMLLAATLLEQQAGK